MFVVPTYSFAVIMCVVTMLCWGSWANTQKMAQKSWRFELYYWDYVIGIVITSLFFAFTLGSHGEAGRSFAEDLSQAGWGNIGSAFLGGVIFNAANILIVAAIAIAGMSVAFPVGIGIALVLGVLVNYLTFPKGDVFWLFTGVGLVLLAIIFDALAYRKRAVKAQKVPAKGILISLIGGVLMALFYKFVAGSMASDFEQPQAGFLTPYTAVVIFALGILLSNVLFNTIIMKIPVEGAPVSYKDYLSGTWKEHFTGILGGIIWCIGMTFSIIAAGKAGFAISYGLGQGATLVAALWGVFIWKEFKGARDTRGLITAMFVFFVAGLAMIVYAGL